MCINTLILSVDYSQVTSYYQPQLVITIQEYCSAKIVTEI